MGPTIDIRSPSDQSRLFNSKNAVMFFHQLVRVNCFLTVSCRFWKPCQASHCWEHIFSVSFLLYAMGYFMNPQFSAKVGTLDYSTWRFSEFVFFSVLFSLVWSGRGSVGKRRCHLKSGFGNISVKMRWQLWGWFVHVARKLSVTDQTTSTKSWWGSVFENREYYIIENYSILQSNIYSPF